MAEKRKVGLIGFGQIGTYVYEQISAHPEYGVEIVFVSDVDKKRLEKLPSKLILDKVEGFASRKPDMVCELAHPNVSRQYAEMVLKETDYFLLSVTALADVGLEDKLKATATKSGTRLFIPHGGVMGLDSIIEGKDSWEEVKFVMKKNPRNIDFTWSGIDPSKLSGVTTLYEGPTRGICPLFPRNVNTHATVALGGIGFDRTVSILISDPALDVATLEISAKGGGVDLELKRSAAIKGVSGVATLRSVYKSIVSTAPSGPGMQFC